VRVDWAIPCRYAEINAGLATVVGAQVDAVRVVQFPARVGTWLAIRFVFGDGEASTDHEVVLRILDPDLGEIGETRTSLTLGPPNPEKVPGWEGSHVMATFVQFDARDEGTHTFEVYVDGRHQQTLPFSIRGPEGEQGRPSRRFA
jgi:hypothetical protein